MTDFRFKGMVGVASSETDRSILQAETCRLGSLATDKSYVVQAFPALMLGTSTGLKSTVSQQRGSGGMGDASANSQVQLTHLECSH